MSEDLHFGTIAGIAPLIRDKRLSPVELTRSALARIDRLDSRLHALSNRRGAAASETTAAASQPRVEQVPHGITQHVETVHHDRQAHPGP